MGFLNFKKQPEYLQTIRARLKRRNLVMDADDEWVVHGPHGLNFNYQVYIGMAYDKLDESLRCTCRKNTQLGCAKHKNGFEVVIYPWAVYELDSKNWWEVEAKDRIPVLK